MRRELLSVSMFLMLAFFASLPQSFAALTISNGGGAWEEPGTWLRDGTAAVPQAGDIIIISGADIVTISTTIDLSTANNGTPTTLVIHGILKFFTPVGGCDNAACDIDLKLDEGSEVFVEGEEGIQQEGPGAGQQDIVIGGNNILNQLPYGPGNLPEDAPLPIKLKFFQGEPMDHSNMLHWQTEIEVNTKEFVVERSAYDRQDFAEIATVRAAGNSETFQNYHFEDKNPLGMGYYRLKAIDLNGAFEYSGIISVEQLITHTTVEIFPLPVREEINLRLSVKDKSFAQLRIVNTLGQVLSSERLQLEKGLNQFSFPWKNVDGGYYFMIIENNTEQIVRKLF